MPVSEVQVVDLSCCLLSRFANKGLGYQEKAVLKQKYEDAKARGEAPPDVPGMKQLLADMKTTN